MKKNRMMRLASVLLVLTLLTTSMISGTFAKYVTSGEATDTARVAKWGVTFDIQGGPLFDTKYAATDSKYSTDMSVSVKSSGTDNVVAPGTEGTAVTFRTQGTPEVSYEVTMELLGETALETIFTNNDIAVGYDNTTKAVTYTATPISNGYYPVVFELNYNGNVVETDGNSGKYTDVTKLKTALDKCGYYFNVDNGKYYVTTDGGTNYGAAQATAPNLEINWAWAFEASGTDKTANDVHDTTLGNLMAAQDGTGNTLASVVTPSLTDGTDYNLEIKMTLKATATQID